MIWVAILFSGLGSILLVLDVQPVWIQFVVLAIGLSLFIPVMYQEFVGSKKIKEWVNQRILLLLLIPFLIVVNIFVRKYEAVWDYSYANYLSLRQETIQELARLQSPLEIIIFTSRDDKSLTYVELMKERISKYTDKVQVQILNINQEIALANKYDVRKSGGAVLISDIHWVKIESFQEKYLVPGLAKLYTTSHTEICSLYGHGENDIDNERFDGLSKLKHLLIDYGYQIKLISLLNMENAQALLEQCSILFLMSPKLKFLKHELTILEKAIEKSCSI